METVMKVNEKYNNALRASFKSVYIMTALAGFIGILYGSRTTVWIEYAKTFNDFSMTSASWIMYIDALILGVAGLGFASIADYVGFDKSVTFKILMVTTGCIIEAFAFNFKLLCIGFLISQTAIVYIAVAYISWILPHAVAQKYIPIYYAIGAVFYLSGPVLSSGLYSIFRQYQIIFIVNAALMSSALILCILFFYGKQRKLEKQQITSCTEIDDNSNNLFPSYIASTSISSKKNAVDQETKKSSIRTFCSELSSYQWYIILNIATEMGIAYNFEAILFTYYIPFMLRKYNGSHNMVSLCGIQLAAMCIFGVISAAFLPKLQRFLNVNYVICMFGLFVIGSAFILIGDYSFHISWIIIPFFGSMFMFGYVVLDWMLLDVIIKKHSGKINGIKCIIQNTLRGIQLLLIGLFWNVDKNSMIYVTIASAVLLLVLHFVMWLVQRINN